MSQAIEELVLSLLNKNETCAPKCVSVRTKGIPYFGETYALIAHGLQRFYGTVLKEIVFSCLNCFGITYCRRSVRLCFSFYTYLH